jgi:hypothetical protein
MTGNSKSGSKKIQQSVEVVNYSGKRYLDKILHVRLPSEKLEKTQKILLAMEDITGHQH